MSENISKTTKNTEDITNANEKIDEHIALLTSQGETIASNTEKITALESSVETQNGNITELQNKSSQFESQIGSHTSSIDSINQNIESKNTEQDASILEAKTLADTATQKVGELSNLVEGHDYNFIGSGENYDYRKDIKMYYSSFYGMLAKFPGNAKYTTGGSTNTFISDSDGLLCRVSSARKYKDDIKYLDDLDHAKKILNINPASWYDKAEERRVANGEEKTLNRYYGFIADDFGEQGLEEVVIRDSEGEIDSLAYDRISIYLLQLIKDLYKENDSLKEEIKQLKEAIK